MNEIKNWLKQYPFVYENMKFLGILLLACAAYIFTKKVLVKIIEKIVSRTSTTLDDIIFNKKVLRRFSLVAPLIVFHSFTYLLPDLQNLLNRIIASLIAVLILLTFGSLISSINEIYENTDRFKDKPIKGYLQIVKIIIYVFGAIVIVGIFTGESITTLLGGVGALMAVIILVFKDTILSFVASIQITSYDLVKVGDWIEVPKYGADGDVIDIALHAIKIQNWDKTITVIPTYKLIEDSFKNWRGMTQSGGRRIKRAVFIDQSTIKFCDVKMIERFEKFHLITNYIKAKQEELKKHNAEKKIDNTQLVNGRRLTNIGTFRAYLKEYLKQREDIHKEMTFMVRQLQPGPEGLPIEIYVFTTTTAWVEYEGIQADIFDHILAVVPQFDLQIFQNPTGSDFKNIIIEKTK